MRILIRKGPAEAWKPVDAADYSVESELQKMLADAPDLVPIGDIHEGVEPFAASVREFGLPGSGSTDVVLVNPDGHIGVIECKLADNPEIKRKVIGQVFEYGAYLWGTSYEAFDARVQARRGVPLAKIVAQGLDDETWDEESFRTTVAENLEEGAFTLVIAVDRINDELERTVRFLNHGVAGGSSLAALELRRFQSDGTEILVPRLYGPQPSSLGGRRTEIWSESRLLAEFEKLPEDTYAIVRDLYEWGKARGLGMRPGSGDRIGTATARIIDVAGREVPIFRLGSQGRLRLLFKPLRSLVGGDALEEFLSSITSNQGLRGISTEGFPSVPIADAFVELPEAVEEFKQAVQRLCERLRTG